jgi:hypothetical protein
VVEAHEPLESGGSIAAQSDEVRRTLRLLEKARAVIKAPSQAAPG